MSARADEYLLLLSIVGVSMPTLDHLDTVDVQLIEKV